MSYRVSVKFGILAFIFAVTGSVQAAGQGGFGSGAQRPAARSVAPTAGGYSRVPAYRGYSTGHPYPGFYAGNRGAPAVGYGGGGRWFGGWGPRAYYGPGLPWYPLAAGYAPYWYGAVPYYSASPAYYGWNPGYGGYVVMTPSPVAARPAAVVAPAPAPPPPAEEMVLKGVDFETASAELRPESTAILDGVADTIRRCNCSGVEIRGYTDSVGDRDYNQKLSNQRANAVKDYLERHGVPAGLLSAQGFGEDSPIARNTTSEGRGENRRVTVQFSAPAGTQRQR